MAVDELTCGQGGSDGLTIVTRINELAKLDPRVSLRLNDPDIHPVQEFTDDPTPILMLAFDDIKTERTGFVGEISTQSMKNNSGHPFESCILTLGLNVEFAATEVLEVYLYVDGAPYSNYPITLVGQGTGNPTEITWQSDISIPAGAVLDLRARNSEIGTLIVTYLRTHAMMEASWKETLQV